MMGVKKWADIVNDGFKQNKHRHEDISKNDFHIQFNRGRLGRKEKRRPVCVFETP
jgi:hypothetical protein